MTRGVQTKSAAILSALERAGKPIKRDALHQRVETMLRMVIGRQRFKTLLARMHTQGEIVVRGEYAEGKA